MKYRTEIHLRKNSNQTELKFIINYISYLSHDFSWRALIISKKKMATKKNVHK